MSNNVTIAVIGCGRIAKGAHFPALSKIEGVRVKYACDLIEEKAQAMKDTYPDLIEQVITDYNVALSDPEVEAVFVLTPNFAHYTVTMDALKAGKHVMCEKPVTINYELSCEMAKEADKQGKILNIGVCNRYHASVVKLEEMNREGKFGNIYHISRSWRRIHHQGAVRRRRAYRLGYPLPRSHSLHSRRRKAQEPHLRCVQRDGEEYEGLQVHLHVG